jgi:indole-3-glycerol phosphate synthase
VASVAAMATATLLLVWFLDHPFEDQAGSITPIEMEVVLEVIDEESLAEGIEVTPPCTDSGDPLNEAATAGSV